MAGVPGAVGFSGPGTSRSVQITPMTASAVFEMIGVEVGRPHLLIDEPDGASLYKINAKVTWGSRTFFVVRPPEVFAGIVEAGSHCSVVLTEDT